MAEGLYKATGQVAAVVGNPRPGSANLLPGAGDQSWRRSAGGCQRCSMISGSGR